MRIAPGLPDNVRGMQESVFDSLLDGSAYSRTSFTGNETESLNHARLFNFSARDAHLTFSCWKTETRISSEFSIFI